VSLDLRLVVLVLLALLGALVLGHGVLLSIRVGASIAPVVHRTREPSAIFHGGAWLHTANLRCSLP
jgi:hypothetical protein